MKTVLVICLSFLTGIALSAQWNPVYTDANKTYSDASFPTAVDGFVLGSYSSGATFILKTADGGVTWTEIALPQGFFNQIAMYSATEGYVSSGGVPGILLYTNDAFATTTSHLLDASFSTTGLDVLNDSSGFYMNNGSRFRSFGEYGDTISILMDTLTGADAFDVADDSTVYVANGIHLLKSTDAGATWFCVNSNLTASIGISLVFINADTGYYLRDGGPGIWQTVDGGISFQTVDNYYGLYLDAKGQYCSSVFGLGTIRWSANYGQSWILESLGMAASNGTYLSPIGDCYVTNNSNGEIRKRYMPLSVETVNETSSAISVFPNPASDMITIAITDKTVHQNMRVVIVNALGETVLQEALPANGSVSIAGLASGIYSCQIWNGEGFQGAEMISKQ